MHLVRTKYILKRGVSLDSQKYSKVTKHFPQYILLCMAWLGYQLNDGHVQCMNNTSCKRGKVRGTARRLHFFSRHYLLND